MMQQVRKSFVGFAFTSAVDCKPQDRRFARKQVCKRNVFKFRAQALPSTTQQVQEAQQHPAINAAAEKSKQLKALYDGLVEVHTSIAEATRLQQTATKVSSDGHSSYGTEDGLTSIQLLVNKGDKVAWMSSVCSSLRTVSGGFTTLIAHPDSSTDVPVLLIDTLFFFGKVHVILDLMARGNLAMIGGGIARVTAFADDSTDAPHLNFELGYVFGSITMYLNLTARVNLLLDDAYFKKYYQQKTKSGLSINDLELQLQADEAWQPFRSKSPDVRMLAGQTALLYSAEGSEENVQKAVEYGKLVTEMWLEFINDSRNTVPEGKQAELEAHDHALYPFPRKDPGNAIIVGLLGAEKTEEILRLTCRDPKILI